MGCVQSDAEEELEEDTAPPNDHHGGHGPGHGSVTEPACTSGLVYNYGNKEVPQQETMAGQTDLECPPLAPTKDTKNLHNQYNNRKSRYNTWTGRKLPVNEYSVEALAGGALDLAVITGKDRRWIFPKWGSHKKCSYCCSCDANKKDSQPGRKQNNQKMPVLQDGTYMTLANMLAMVGGLDLSTSVVYVA